MKLSLFLVSIVAWATAASAAAVDWPEGYLVQEGSETPDGRYGILIPGRDLAGAPGPDYVADLKAHRTIVKIPGAEYFEGKNHSGLIMTWADDSSWGALEGEGRWGFDLLWVIEKGTKGFTTREIGHEIRQTMRTVISRQERGKEGDTVLYYSVNDDRTLSVQGTTRTNPKYFDDEKTLCGLFTGVYTLKSAKWTRAEGRPITAREHEALEFAWNYTPGDAARDLIGSRDRAEKLQLLDEKLNRVYLALKFLMPAAGFANLKQGQLVWLKRRDELSGDPQCKFVEYRIEELVKLVPDRKE